MWANLHEFARFVVNTQRENESLAFLFFILQRAAKPQTLLPRIRPSVCPSVTLLYCVKTREHRGMRFSPLGSPVSLGFSDAKNG